MSSRKFLEVGDVFDHLGRSVVCVDVFRATGTFFARCVEVKDYSEHKARRYVPSTYVTVPEWNKIQKGIGI